MAAVGKFVRNLLLACVGAGCVLAFLHSRGGMTTIVTLERAGTEAEREHCEILFVGPSYTKAQVKPEIFDAEAKRMNMPLRSCTFGAPGLRSLELRMHVDAMLRKRWPRLKLVIADITLGQSPRLDLVNWYQPRVIAWHDWGSAVWLARYYERERAELKAARVGAHLAHFAANYTNLGVGLQWLETLQLTSRARGLFGQAPALSALPTEEHYEAKQRNRATAVVPPKPELSAELQARFDKRISGIARRKARLTRKPNPVINSWALDMRKLVKKRVRVDTLFVLAPVMRAVTEPTAVPRGRRKLVLWDFNLPKRYPDLYLAPSRGSTHHLSRAGSEIYTRLLAKRVVKHMRKKR